MTKDEALTMALGALDIVWNSGMPCPNIGKVGRARTAIKEALAQPQQEPYFRFRECEDSQAEQPAPVQQEPVAYPFEDKSVRNQTLEEVAREFDKMKSLGDTAASFAAYVRNMKK